MRLDDDGAGRGWFVDRTPGDDREFGGRGPAGYDLLTVVEHELGHVIGFDDIDTASAPADLMAAHLAPGVRRLPGAGVVGSVSFAPTPWTSPAAADVTSLTVPDTAAT